MVSGLRDKITAVLRSGPQSIRQITDMIYPGTPSYEYSLRKRMIRKYIYQLRDEGKLICHP